MRIIWFVVFGFLGSISTSYAQDASTKELYQLEQKNQRQKLNFKSSHAFSNYDLVYQRMHWQLDPAERFISGSIFSYFKIVSDSMQVLNFDLESSMVVDSVCQGDSLLTYELANDILSIYLPSVVYQHTLDSLCVYYHGVPSESGFGSFRTTKHNNTPVLWTLSEPYGARDWWPCKQSLNDKIDSIDIVITVPPGNKVGTNGTLQKTVQTDSSITYFWRHRHPIATYLVALAVTNYDEFTDYAMINSSDSVPILNYVYPENLETAREQAKYTIDLIELFSHLFIPYPFGDEKYGHAQFSWGGGMEHQTMSFMSNFSESLIAHELAHQWFGDHITCGSWADIWVNEGFAVWCESLAIEHLHKNEYQDWLTDRILNVLSTTQSGSIYVEDTSSVSRIFNTSLSYNKAGMVIHQLRHQLGDEKFFAGIQSLLQSNTAFAHTKDVQNALEAAADTNLSLYFQNWIYGEGYPKFTLDFYQDERNGSFTLSQKGTSSKSIFFPLTVPIQFIGEKDTLLRRFQQTVNHEEFFVDLPFQVKQVVLDPDYTLITPHPAQIIYEHDRQLKEEKLLIAPNPADDTVNLEWLANLHVFKIELFNAKGKLVFSFLLNERVNSFTVHTGQLKAGQYVFKVYSDKEKFSRKVILL